MNSEFLAFYTKEIRKRLPLSDFSHVYDYALFPPGKLFRPMLLLSLCEDLQLPLNKESFSIASALEIHHTYTLLHDDLPCMDDDDYRRGKLSTHKKFGQWQALLAGDGLLNLSYEFLSLLPSRKASLALKLFSRYLGPRGLIQGQAYDLEEGHELKSHFNLKIHELKTARLIQVATLAPVYILSSVSPYKLKAFSRLGLSLGLVFQLFDDLSELIQTNSSTEFEKNLFILHPKEAFDALKFQLDYVQKFILKNNCLKTSSLIQTYLKKIERIITEERDRFEKNLTPFLIEPVFSLLNNINKG